MTTDHLTAILDMPLRECYIYKFLKVMLTGCGPIEFWVLFLRAILPTLQHRSDLATIAFQAFSLIALPGFDVISIRLSRNVYVVAAELFGLAKRGILSARLAQRWCNMSVVEHVFPVIDERLMYHRVYLGLEDQKLPISCHFMYYPAIIGLWNGTPEYISLDLNTREAITIALYLFNHNRDSLSYGLQLRNALLRVSPKIAANILTTHFFAFEVIVTYPDIAFLQVICLCVSQLKAKTRQIMAKNSNVQKALLWAVESCFNHDTFLVKTLMSLYTQIETSDSELVYIMTQAVNYYHVPGDCECTQYFVIMLEKIDPSLLPKRVWDRTLSTKTVSYLPKSYTIDYEYLIRKTRKPDPQLIACLIDKQALVLTDYEKAMFVGRCLKNDSYHWALLLACLVNTKAPMALSVKQLVIGRLEDYCSIYANTSRSLILERALKVLT